LAGHQLKVGSEVLLTDLRNVVVTGIDDALEDVPEHLKVALVEHFYAFVNALAQRGDALLPVLEVLLLELLKACFICINNARKSVESLAFYRISSLAFLLSCQRLFLGLVATPFSELSTSFL